MESDIKIEITINWNLIKAVALFASTDSTRYVLNGVLVECDPRGSAVLCATDGRRLGAYRTNVEVSSGYEGPTFRAIIPVSLIKRISSKRNDIILRFESRSGTTWIAVSDPVARCEIGSPAIDGDFPNWRQVCPVNPLLPTVPVHVNSGFLDDYAKVAKLLRCSCGIAFYSEKPDGNSPIAVRMTDPDFASIIMPMRADDYKPGTPLPSYSLPEWSAVQALPA